MTKRLLKMCFSVVILIVFSLVLGTTISYAQGPGAVNGPCGFGGPEDSFVAIAAQTLGMPQTELVTALRSGKAIADIAKDKGIALEKIAKAVLAERQQMLKNAVAAKHLTQQEADAMLAIMNAHIIEHLSQPFGFQSPGIALGGYKPWDMGQMSQIPGRRGTSIR
jgi:hypothetical protein